MKLSFIKKFSIRMPKHFDSSIHLSILGLLVFGSIMIASTMVGESNETVEVVIIAIVKQCVFVAASYFLMTFVARNFTKCLSKNVRLSNNQKKNAVLKHRYRTAFKLIGIAIIAMLILTLFDKGSRGSNAWIYIGRISLQPSEFAKVYLIVLMGLVVNDYGNLNISAAKMFREPIIFFIIIMIIIGMQPDFGTALVILAISSILLLIPSTPKLDKTKKVIVCLIILAFACLFIFSTDFGLRLLNGFSKELGYKLSRFTSANDPFKQIYNGGYNLVYSIYAIANGGLKGLGLGNSGQKFGYLPEAQTDFILSITIEELGIFGFGFIVLCYVVIIYKLVYFAMKTKSEGFKMILIGCVLYLSLHFALNVGVSGLIPLTGVPLLFISSGGSSLLSIMTLLGICQSIIALTKGQMDKLNEN